MSYHLPSLSFAFASALLAVACGQSTTNSESSATSGGSSSVDDGGARGGSAQSDGGTDGNAVTGSTNSSDAGGMTQSAATDDSTGGTTDSTASSTTTAGGEDSTTGSAGGTSMTAEQMGCIITRSSLDPCSDPSEPGILFACPRDAPVPDTCSECYQPGVDEATGHPVNQCLAMLPDGGYCQNCCCEPSESGCEERTGDTGCDVLPDMPRRFVCVKPYEEPSGCFLDLYSDLVDEYCCP